MALPSRSYVGLTVFGLIATISLGSYALLLIVGYEIPPPANRFLPERVRGGEALMLTLGLILSASFTWFSFRSLVAGARRDALREESDN